MFENVEIFQDDDVKIEMAGWFDFFLREVYIPVQKITSEQFEVLAPFINSYLMFLNPKKYQISYWGKAPIFQPYKLVYFDEPFDIFMDAQEIISMTDKIEDRDELINRIYEVYEKKDEAGRHYCFHMFKQPIQNIWGFFICIDDNTKAGSLMFWVYEPNEST